ncbi:MAG: sodium:solute symporter family protein [Planctomycetota bacterium]
MNKLHPVDAAILVVYLIATLVAGALLSRRASKDFDSYFLGGRKIPWYALGVSNASGMFDATGTMVMVAWMLVYGVKSLWIPWLWPTFNQVVMMVFLAAFIRRTGAVTGADLLRTRFGKGIGLELAHLGVVAFALVAVVAFIAYAFLGVGKFAELILPWDYSANTYALTLMLITTVYVMLGGMHSVVLTDVIQFALLTVASVAVGLIAMSRTTAESIASATPAGWGDIGFGWRLDLDWTGKIDHLNTVVANDIYASFAPFVLMAFANGVLKSVAGPTPGYDMQRVLAARNEREASLMSAIVSPVLFLPRYLLITGISVLALVYYSDAIQAQGADADFEQVLPWVIAEFIPVGLSGLLLAGLFAAFMSTFDSNLNAGAAYMTNDLYRRYVNPGARPVELAVVSYASCALIVVAGIWIGFKASTINDSMQWIAGALFGGYAAPNVLKWVWWRLNAPGYMAGMTSGVLLALWLHDQSFFVVAPTLVAASGLVSVVVSLLTPADDPAVLDRFYRLVRPWGYWGPVRERVVSSADGFIPNDSFARDMFNCGVGIVWQLSLCAAPVFLVLHRYGAAAIAAALAVVTTTLLKRCWYDCLPSSEACSTD